MKSFLHYRLITFSALIICGVFTGSCRAEIDTQCQLLFRQTIFDSGDYTCISEGPVPACPEICHPVSSYDKEADVICFKKDDPFGKETKLIKSVSVPDRCELTLPVAVKPPAEQ
ncbi:hypothetical protein AYY18_17145 [Morganella psychrotolerans]|uniref:Uncharacterized protein n=1 Tax=Morganella psychrotolerans TaxID=368603 RepID=A0A1B8HR68_9GAMM|nr:hypothetical protein AYY18_17145 [Morganella psychrotolerans]